MKRYEMQKPKQNKKTGELWNKEILKNINKNTTRRVGLCGLQMVVRAIRFRVGLL